MKERPILFSTAMIRAILVGKKSQTRRIVKPEPSAEFAPIVGHYHPTLIDKHGDQYPGTRLFGASDEDEDYPCPYGEPGDRLWVRETWRTDSSLDGKPPRSFAGWPVKYLADGHVSRYGAFYGDLDPSGQTRTSIHMPRWASRITLEVTGVRVERVQDISEEDAVAEGVQAAPFCKAGRASGLEHVEAFEGLWQLINGADSWAANPHCWVISFRRL